jgi:hypothetical protein
MKPEIIPCEQGSPEWYAARLGLVTASEYKTIIGVKKDAREKITRQTYMRKLAGEIITGEPMESYTNSYLERGTALEDEAREFYSFTRSAELQRVGFIKNGKTGCSPDSLIGKDGGLEIKVALPHVQIERLEKGELPPEHVAQVQGNIFVTGRKWWEFVSYCPKMPLFVVRAKRDDEYIKMIAEAVDAFNAELTALVDKVKGYAKAA